MNEDEIRSVAEKVRARIFDSCDLNTVSDDELKGIISRLVSEEVGGFYWVTVKTG